VLDRFQASLTARLLLASSGWLGFGAYGAAAPTPVAQGQELQAVLAMPELPISELVARTLVAQAEGGAATPAETPVQMRDATTAAAPTGDGAQAAAPMTLGSQSLPTPAMQGGLPVGEVIGSDAVTFDQLIARAAATQSTLGDPGAPASAIATTLPKQTKAQLNARSAEASSALRVVARSASTPVVRVEIPAVADAEPIARRVDAKASAAMPQVAAAPAREPKRETTAREDAALVAEALAQAEAEAAKADAQDVKSGHDANALLPKPLALAVKEAIGGGLALEPESLAFTQIGQSAAITMQARVTGLSVFVRDQHIVRLDKNGAELVAMSRGQTELYVVASGKMYIVPVTVQDDAKRWDLQVPDALVSLDGLFHGQQQSAVYPNVDQATVAAVAASDDAPSLQDSIAQTTRSLAEADSETQRYGADTATLTYKPVTFQLVDERSAPAQGRVYPVANAEVHLIGTEFVARTDATGHLTIRDMPANSRFLVRIDDPAGGVQPEIAELWTKSEKDTGVQRLRTLRTFTYDAYGQIAGAVPDAALGSLCVTLSDKDQERAPAAGIAVDLDVEAEGPYYTNSLGLLDRGARATGPDGRVCFFNVPPGPVAMSAFEGETFLATVPFGTFQGRHVEQDVLLGDERVLRTRLAAMATAHEQLGADIRLANSYKTIDMIDLIPLGANGSPMMQLAPGLVSTSDAVLPSAGRLRAFSQAAEFEPAVYTYSLDRRDNVTPLLPRGFVEDMSIYAQVVHDPSLGSVLVEYGQSAGVDTGEGLSMRLVDAQGQDVGDGWYFADTPVTKAIFFNVPAGVYALLVETRDGYWLAADTVSVYNETVSYTRLGGGIRYRP
jgi:hypothetical protein